MKDVSDKPKKSGHSGLEKHKEPGASVVMPTLISERVAIRAYQVWEQRGCRHGFDLDDWLTAEQELADQGID